MVETTACIDTIAVIHRNEIPFFLEGGGGRGQGVGRGQPCRCPMAIELDFGCLATSKDRYSLSTRLYRVFASLFTGFFSLGVDGNWLIKV